MKGRTKGPTKGRMKGWIIGTVFALPFLGVGIWMLWSIGSTCHDAWQMSRWQPAEARLEAAGFKRKSGDNSDTYEAYARYSYSVSGQSFTGERVSIAAGGDNIGDFQKNLGSRLAAAMGRGERITVWVDPDDWSQSIVDRSIRWELLGFKAIFMLVFGGVGLVVLIAVWSAPGKNDESAPATDDAPWLQNADWQSPVIRSDAKSAMRGAWLFAAVWSLICAPLPFVIYREVVEKQNSLALVGLLFPIVGVGLLVWAIRRTLEWRRFGATPVILDPYPGSIGGHVGGSIDTRIPFSSANKFLLTLTNLHSYMSGSGDSRSRREKALWQDELVATTEASAGGTRLEFRFDVPDGLDESDAEHSGDSYRLWRLSVRAPLQGTDFDRDFTVPVYATATTSEHLADRDAQSARAERDALQDEAVRGIVRIETHGIRKTLVYPMGSNLYSNLAGFVIGSVFAAAGGYLIVSEGMIFFGGTFFAVGSLIALIASYMMLKSLDVSWDGTSIVAVRRWLGIPIARRAIRPSDFEHFEKISEMQSQIGGKHVMYYKVLGVDRHANRLTLGEGFRGEAGADAGIRLLARELGLGRAKVVSRPPRATFRERLVDHS